jgi:hypothetical protein
VDRGRKASLFIVQSGAQSIAPVIHQGQRVIAT